jgi:NACHT domain
MLKNHVNFNVAYNSLERENEGVSICMENTRTRVLQDIRNWAEDKDGVPVCWLYGPAGSGKSTIAHTITQEYDQGESGKKVAFSYFFSRRNPDRNDMTKFVPTFAYQLAHFLPSVQKSMRTALNDPSILTNRRQDQFTNLIIRPVRSITKLSSPMIIVIDGLDEYDELSGEFPLKDLIQLLVRNLPGLPFRLLFTSRPEARINTIFSSMSSTTCCIALQDYRVNSDEIFDYLRLNLSNIREPGELPQGWPSARDLRRLARKSEGIWIYASTLIKFVDDEYDYPPRKLELALKAYVGLDALFEQVLGDAKKYPHFSLVLGALVFVRNNSISRTPPSISCISQLLQLNSVSDVRVALRGCLSILLVPDHNDGYIRPYHASLFDFLTNPNRRRGCFIDPINCNRTIVEGCIQLITAASQGDAFRYACLHWCHHIWMLFSSMKDVSDITSNLGNRVKSFLKDLLPWFQIWMVGCGEPEAVEQARNDLHAARRMVGQVMLICMC